jgi:hypothetical protein
MREYEDITGKYRIDTMPPMVGVHVARKILPIVTGFGGLATLKEDVLKELGSQEGKDALSVQNNVWAKVEPILIAARPLINELATMADKDIDYIIQTCMTYVFKEDKGGLSVAVFNKRAGAFQYELKLRTLLTLTAVCIIENFSDFFFESE